MAAINRIGSPMNRYDETLDESRDKAAKRKQKLRNDQKVRSPFLVGSIEAVNKKISKLDRKLQSYTQLVVDSRASEYADDFRTYSPPPSAKGREVLQRKEKEIREVNKFAGVFAIQSTVGVPVTDRVKHISKISMQPSKASLKKDSGKPRFVELHQYPGYDPSELTPLPHEVSTPEILTKVAMAQPKMHRKPQYLPEFERMFYSQMSQAVLLDTFWWFFLEKYQSSGHYQVKLFNRVAHNYVKLLMYARTPQYREVFFRDYPSLLSQAVYTAFCTSFPNSYRQFNKDFKEDLVILVYEWVAGVRPAPRSWTKWNLDALEPMDVKMREEMMNNSKNTKNGSVLNFDMVENMTGQLTGSHSTLNQLGSVSSMSSHPPGHRGYKPSRRGTVRKSVAVCSTGSDFGAIQLVAEAQESATEKSSPRRRSNGMTSSTQSKGRLAELKQEQQEALSPIREKDEEPSFPATRMTFHSPDVKSKASIEYAKSYVSMGPRSKKLKKESHPVGKGAEFTTSVFNIHGQSPLVAHFLRMKNLQAEAGTIVKVQRTEIENLPPLDAPTYHQLVKESFKNVQQLEKDYQRLVEKGLHENARFIRKQRASIREHMKKETALLSRSQELKRLSDLIILEQRKDQDSVTAGADAAIEAAMAAAAAS